MKEDNHGGAALVDRWQEFRSKVSYRWAWSRAKALNKASAVVLRTRSARSRHGRTIEVGYWTLALIVTLFLVSLLHPITDAYATATNISAYQALYLSIGQAMIGATAIAGTFVLFAMQVNVERLPHGLFRRFSSDRRLLTAFVISIVISILLTCLSLSDAPAWVGTVMAAAIWAVIVNLRLLLYAYGRSLDLISPLEQLAILKRDGDAQVRVWERRFRWLGPVVKAQLPPPPPPAFDGDSVIDVTRLAILQANQGWHHELKQSLAHSIEFARRAFEQGDTESARTALSTAIAINACYLRIKGRTFFSENPLFPTGISTDGFINDTLEQLRQLGRVGISRSDERQIEQVFRAFLLLTRLYLSIEYPGHANSKTHALLAAGYLEGAVESVIPATLTDTLMEGVRVMGQAAEAVLAGAGAQNTVSLIGKISQIGLVGIARPKDRPVTFTSMEQLANHTIALFRCDDANLHFVFGELRTSIRLVADLFLNIPEKRFGSEHRTYLGPYFSSVSPSSFRGQMTVLVNAVLEADEESADAKRVIGNIEEWADGLYKDIKALLLLAIDKRSMFALDLLQWIESMADLLLALAQAPSCGERDRDELQKHVNWMVSSISWIPIDEQTARFVEGFRPADRMFDIALIARQRGAPDVTDTCRKHLLRWSIDAGSFQTGWGTLSRGLTALVAMAALDSEFCNPDWLKAQLTEKLAQTPAPDQERRDHAARDLREAADELRMREFEINSIERVLAAGDHEASRTLLNEVAAILSPATVNEIRRGPFGR